MANWTTLPNTAVGVGGLPSGTTVTALRDNPVAIAEQDASVPVGLRLGFWPLGTITTTSGSTQSLTGLNLTDFKYLIAEFIGISATGASPSISLGSHQVVSAGNGSSANHGLVIVSLANSGRVNIFGSLTLATSTSASGITQASTTVSVSVGAGSFSAGSVVIYGVK